MERPATYGIDKRTAGLPISEILKWPEAPPPFIQTKAPTGKWLSETKDQFLSYVDPRKAAPEPVHVQSNDLKLDESKVVEKVKEKKSANKTIKLNLQSRTLSDTAFAGKFKKPIFAQFGQSNTSAGTKRLFDRGYMKTFNVLPLSADSCFVQTGAKMKTFVNSKTKKSAQAKTQTLKNPENQEAAVDVNENLPENREDDEKVNNSVEKEKVESGTQSIAVNGALCNRCFAEFDPQNQERYKRDEKVHKNPRAYKGGDPRTTSFIPSAGKSKIRSESAVQVIFGQ